MVSDGIGDMLFDKAFCAGSILQDDISSGELFERLVAEISRLPEDQRGAKALELSARLLELAAFELAGHLGSEEIGSMILRSAELSGRSADLEQMSSEIVQRRPPRLQ
jgi:hypothetical protein